MEYFGLVHTHIDYHLVYKYLLWNPKGLTCMCHCERHLWDYPIWQQFNASLGEVKEARLERNKRTWLKIQYTGNMYIGVGYVHVIFSLGANSFCHSISWQIDWCTLPEIVQGFEWSPIFTGPRQITRSLNPNMDLFDKDASSWGLVCLVEFVRSYFVLQSVRHCH